MQEAFDQYKSLRSRVSISNMAKRDGSADEAQEKLSDCYEIQKEYSSKTHGIIVAFLIKRPPEWYFFLRETGIFFYREILFSDTSFTIIIIYTLAVIEMYETG